MKTEKLTYTHNDVFVEAGEQPMIVKAARSYEPDEEEAIIVKASPGSVEDSPLDQDWLSSNTELKYEGGLLSFSGTTYSTNNVEACRFIYEAGGVLKQTVEKQTENDGATIRQTRTTDLTYDSEGLLMGITETVE